MIDLIMVIMSTIGGDLGDINLATLNLKEDRGSITSSNNTGIASGLKRLTPEYPKDPEQEKNRRKIENLKKLRNFPYRKKEKQEVS